MISRKSLWWLVTTSYIAGNPGPPLSTLPFPSLSLDKPPDPGIQTVQACVVTCQILSGPL